MFDELKKYKNNDHFFFEANQKLSEVCNAPTDKSGVYLIYRLAKGKIDLVYIGSSGQKLKDGTLKTRKAGLGGIKDRLVNGKQFGDRRKITFPIVMKLQKIDALDIYWYVTYDEKTKDFPSDIEEKLIAKYYSIYGKLPEWNKEFKMKKANAAATHIAKAPQANAPTKALSKSVSVQPKKDQPFCKNLNSNTHPSTDKNKKTITAEWKRHNYLTDKNRQCITTCIKHLAVSGLSSISARIKSCFSLIGNRFEMPNVSYTQPSDCLKTPSLP